MESEDSVDYVTAKPIFVVSERVPLPLLKTISFKEYVCLKFTPFMDKLFIYKAHNKITI